MRRGVMLGWAALLLAAADVPPGPAPAPPPALTATGATGVLGRMVDDSQGRDIGRIVDVVVDPTGQARAIVVDVGGFMGVGARRIAVSWSSAHVPPPGAKDERVAIDLTDEQIRSAPDYTDRSKPATIVGPPATADAAPAEETPSKQPDSKPSDSSK